MRLPNKTLRLEIVLGALMIAALAPSFAFALQGSPQPNQVSARVSLPPNPEPAPNTCQADCDRQFASKSEEAERAYVEAWNSGNAACCSLVGGTVGPYGGANPHPGQQGCLPAPECQPEYVNCMTSNIAVVGAQAALIFLQAQYDLCLQNCEEDSE